MTNRTAELKRWILVTSLFVALVVVTGLISSVAHAQVTREEAGPPASSPALGWALVAAALSTGFGCLGAGVAVAYVGAAAVGAVAEKPEIAGRTLIFVGLAEGIAIYGLIIAIMILGKV